MPWVVVWPVLVVGTLVGAFFLGRDLWRRGVRLGHAVSGASDAVTRLSAHADELADAAPVPPVALVRNKEELRADLAAARAARDRRLDERHARYRQVMARWRDIWR